MSESTQKTYEGLARRWRPQTFDDLVGQENVARSLRQALTGGRITHGHLLTGPRGVGKTTTARLVAKALNCEHGPTATPCGHCRHCLEIVAGSHMDTIEIDAASNNSVDDVRELRERVIQAPFSARYKVYIIDEVHMLSTPAFNALLKTLEEPPSHVIFLLATTELEKIPETIRSRCTRHEFRRLSADDIVKRIGQVAEGEGVEVEPGAAKEIYGMIARASEGGMRDALVSFDQLLAMTDGKPDVETALNLLGLSDRGVLTQTIAWLLSGEGVELLNLIEGLVDRGRNLERYIKELVAYLRDLMLLQAGADPALVSLTGEGLDAAKKQAADAPRAALFNILNQMFELEDKLKRSAQARFLIEFTFLRLAQIKPVVPLEEIMKRLQAIPDGALGAGAPPAASSSPAQPAQTSAQPPEAEPALAQSAPAPSSAPPAKSVLPATATPSSPPAASAPPAPSGSLLRRTSSPAIFNDSAPSAAPAPAPAGALGDASREDFMRRWLAELPDYMQNLENYLKKALSFSIGDNVLRIAWPSNAKLAAGRIEHAEILPVLEAALERIHGAPLKIRNEMTAESVPVQSTPSAPRRAASALPGAPVSRPAPVMNDSAPSGSIWADVDSDDAGAGAPEPSEAPGDYDMSPPSTVSASSGVRAAKPAGPSALERARTLLENEDVARRVKMLREMFNGRFIDENGAPLEV